MIAAPDKENPGICVEEADGMGAWNVDALAAVCGDPSVTPEALQACRNEIPTLVCGMNGPLDLTGACAPLYQPFQ